VGVLARVGARRGADEALEQKGAMIKGLSDVLRGKVFVPRGTK
jgi:hypothetical protein